MLIMGMVVLFALLIFCDPFCDFNCRCKNACEKEGYVLAGGWTDSCWCSVGGIGMTEVPVEEGCGWIATWIGLTAATILLMISVSFLIEQVISWVREIE